MKDPRDDWMTAHRKRENRFRASCALVVVLPLLVFVGLAVFGGY